MIAGEQRQLIEDVARDLLARLAPQELPLLRPISQQYFQKLDQVGKSRAGREEMLGFGLESLADFWTPEVLFVATVVVQYLLDTTQQALTTAGTEVVTDLVRGLFKRLRPAAGPPPPALTPEQLARVRSLALEKALQLKVSETKAILLADALVGSLVTAGSTEGEDQP